MSPGRHRDGAPTLLLFDIDGTLLAGATERHGRALHEALRIVHGVDAAALGEPPSPAGRTDGEIARLILRGAGVAEAEIDALAEAVREQCCRIYLESPREDLSGTVLPGVQETLEGLQGREEVLPALLTGNFEPVARRKLDAARIGHLFAPGQGAFGSDSEARVELPALARARAGRWAEHPRKSTIVIGDTPRDIACARADGVRCIAVATGRFGVAELSQAEWVAEDMSAARAVLEDLLG